MLKGIMIYGGIVNGNIPGSWPDDVGSSPTLLNYFFIIFIFFKLKKIKRCYILYW